MGRSRGGFSTKIHVSLNPLGEPLVLKLTAGQESDTKQFFDLVDDYRPDSVMGDMGYDSNANREFVESIDAEVVIPSSKSRKEPIPYDKHLYKERNLVERYFNKLKQFRRVMTRFEKKASNFLGMVQVASIMIMLRSPNHYKINSCP